jgi:hypothetical protein
MAGTDFIHTATASPTRMFAHGHADGHIEWNGIGPMVATLHAQANAIRQAVQISFVSARAPSQKPAGKIRLLMDD